ncbi:hypothetical protein BJV82DRAFT_586073 [Fennellomyces sp. T-0311]|nr:hypothetical protein BJV82DRAFT_586073 [Fennellomyces sp. T-0311]
MQIPRPSFNNRMRFFGTIRSHCAYQRNTLPELYHMRSVTKIKQIFPITELRRVFSQFNWIIGKKKDATTVAGLCRKVETSLDYVSGVQQYGSAPTGRRSDKKTQAQCPFN